MAPGDRLTVADIEQWIANDEGLYRWAARWCDRNIGGQRAFIRNNREELERLIRGTLAGGRAAQSPVAR